jgi:hypothetical protein
MTDLQIKASVYKGRRPRDKFPMKVIAVFAIGVGVLLVGLIAGFRI